MIEWEELIVFFRVLEGIFVKFEFSFFLWLYYCYFIRELILNF